MKLFIYVFSLLSLFAINANGQTDPKVETQRLMTLLTKLEGTYQVQIIDSRELPAIPLSLMDTIIAKRDQNSVKYVWLSEKVRVKILPVSEISQPTFQPLERVVYKSASNLN